MFNATDPQFAKNKFENAAMDTQTVDSRKGKTVSYRYKKKAGSLKQ
jgi:hypothetical protein